MTGTEGLLVDGGGLDPRGRLIFPLDVPDWKRALEYVEGLRNVVGCFKVGLELFVRYGPERVMELREMTAGRTGLFLDLKLHDIPATVGRAMAAAGGLLPDLSTVHAGGGRAMMSAAVSERGQSKVLAVTVLTSIDVSGWGFLHPDFRRPGALVRQWAEDALAAGCQGWVCSGREAGMLRRAFGPEPLIVTPGIRPSWSVVAEDDQKRIVTPAMAIKAGADMLVVGRPIRDASDPAAAAARVVEEIAGAVSDG